jgi:tetratricopeptide (TPR) repeat protein
MNLGRVTMTSHHGPCRRTKWLAPVLLAASLLGGPRSLPAQNVRAADWVGQRVILQANSVLRVGNAVVDDQKRERSARGGARAVDRRYRVERVNGPWLWLQAEGEGAAGWIRAAEDIRYDQAIDYFTRQIRANPANDAAYIGRGNIWRDKKEYDLALADFTEAIRIDPGSEVAHNARGNAWLEKLEYDKAIVDYNEAIRIDPKHARAYYNRGIAWKAKSEYDKAIADYNEAIRIDPKYALAYLTRAVLEMTTRRAGAVAGMRKVVELEKGKGAYAAYAVILGHLATRQAEGKGAAREFLGALARDLDASAWPYPVVRFLRGELTEAQLLALAVDTEKATEARCYLGLRHDLEGRPRPWPTFPGSGITGRSQSQNTRSP